MTPSCPNSTEAGCRCPDHHPGLLAYSRDPVALAAALERLAPKPARPPALTLVHTSGPGCTGTLTCPCETCETERAARLRRGPIGSGARQPWTPRPPRDRRAA